MPSRSERLSKLGNTEERWGKLLQTPDIKLGNTTDLFYAGDANGLYAKSGKVGYQFNEKNTKIRPGRTLSFEIPHALVDFNGKSFHPLCDQQPSTAVFPYPVLVPRILDPETEELIGLLGTLQELSQLL
jgi:hypothetical protein